MEYYDNNYLAHYGIKGMKWGVRRYQNADGSLNAKGIKRYATKGYAQDSYNSNKTKIGKAFDIYTGAHKTQARIKYDTSSEKQNKARAEKYISDKNAVKAAKNTPEAKAARRKKAIKVGAAVVGTALAAYGAYKVSKYIQDKRSDAAIKKASDYVSKNFLDKVGESNFTNGTTISNFQNKVGTNITIKGRGSDIIGQHNAKVVSTGRQMYKDATNTRLDRGLSKIVGAGDAVGNTAKRSAQTVENTIKRTAQSAKSARTTVKNRVLDAVNPLYTYVPGETNSTTRKVNGMNVTKNTTYYYKRKIKR